MLAPMQLCLLLLIFILIGPGQAETSESVTATVTGAVQLQAHRKNIPSILRKIYTGRSETLPLKEGKKIRVRGNYNGTRFVTVEERLKQDKDKGEYHFKFPVISSVIRTLTKKRGKLTQQKHYIRKSYIEFSNSIERVVSRNGQSVLQEFNDFKYNSTLSVTKLIAQRKNNRAILQGTLRDHTKAALGRFRLKFEYF